MTGSLITFLLQHVTLHFIPLVWQSYFLLQKQQQV